MARFATPGVYVKEKNAFSSSVVATPTAIPAFIGYTNKAERGGKNLINIPTKINSLKEYLSFFGKGNTPTFRIKPKSKNDFELTPDKETQFNLYNSLRLFFANGGGVCYIVSVGNYKSGGVKLDDLR
ncbi:MAG: phage tail sheath family protein, partial [Saprospiraceae bacterium]